MNAIITYAIDVFGATLSLIKAELKQGVPVHLLLKLEQAHYFIPAIPRESFSYLIFWRLLVHSLFKL